MDLGWTVYSVQCTVCSVQCAVCSVQCAVYSVTCTVYTAQSESGEALDKQNPLLIKQLSKIQEITHNSIS